MKAHLKSLRSRWNFYRQCYLDSKRFLQSISPEHLDEAAAVARIESDIVRQYHVIEKGLCMPDFRPKFGKDVVTGLVKSIRELAAHPCAASCNPGQLAAARATLREYHDRHLALGIDISDILPASSHELFEGAMPAVGGTRPFTPVDTNDAQAFQNVVFSRASVRDMNPDRVPDRTLIQQAVETALRSPSVCNRQTARVHVFTGDAAQRTLALQSGNRGFGHKIPMVIIVTSDLRFFTGTVERYQGWIDGGMFSMLLLLALHAIGLGAVSLNWSVNNAKDLALRKTAAIPEYERIMMLIGCGYPNEQCRIPVSTRRNPEEIISWNQASENHVEHPHP